jgi:2-keto-4-pentenoate hydratase
VLLAPPNPSCTTPAAVTARVSRDGEEVAATDEPEALNGTVAANVGHVADVLAAAGERLRAGDVVIAGSVVAAQPVAPGQRWRVELPPLGAIDVAFE